MKKWNHLFGDEIFDFEIDEVMILRAATWLWRGMSREGREILVYDLVEEVCFERGDCSVLFTSIISEPDSKIIYHYIKF